MRALLVASFVSAAVLPTGAFAHPHVPGDPFADVGDTIVAGSPRVAAIRGPSRERWNVTDVRDGDRRPVGTIEQRVTRVDTPAGRQWCVAVVSRDAAGSETQRDSMWVSAGSPIPIRWAMDRGAFTFEGRQVTGTYASGGRTIDDATIHLAHAVYPEPLEICLWSRLDYSDSTEAVALAFFDPDFGEFRQAIAVAGQTGLDHAGRERRCWMVTVAEDRPLALNRTLWIDATTHALLREDVRDASGALVEVVEAE